MVWRFTSACAGETSVRSYHLVDHEEQDLESLLRRSDRFYVITGSRSFIEGHDGSGPRLERNRITVSATTCGARGEARGASRSAASRTRSTKCANWSAIGSPPVWTNGLSIIVADRYAASGPSVTL